MRGVEAFMVDYFLASRKGERVKFWEGESADGIPFRHPPFPCARLATG